MHRIAVTLTAMVSAMAAGLVLLASLAWCCGTCSPLMLRMMKTFAPPEATGLAEELYEPVVDMITGYLANDPEIDSFHYTAVYPDGTRLTLFNDREAAHMADCRRLFGLCRELMLNGTALLAFCAALLTAFRHEARARRQGLLRGFGLSLLIAAALLLWGVIDFSSLFLLFHRLAFTNDLWLMDWNRDLIIRLMPQPFFLCQAGLLGGAWLIFTTAGLIVSALLLKLTPKKGT